MTDLLSRAEDRDKFLEARDILQRHADDYETAYKTFRWPDLDEFNWAFDWFDVLASAPESAGRPALWLVEEDGSETRLSFAELSDRSNRVANWMAGWGIGRGDRVLVMLGNQVELWETLLAAMKIGAVVVPTSTLVSESELADRVERAGVSHVVARSKDVATFESVAGNYSRIAVGDRSDALKGWLHYADAYEEPRSFAPPGTTRAGDPLFLYFTSGTTSVPKLVEHSHATYPVGHLATMYWVGLRADDVHLNISSPGWAKHAWSSVFAPWNAAACVFVYNYERFDALALMGQMDRCGVTSFCAPPTVWRMLIQADLSMLRTPPRTAVSAGEPLNPAVIDRVQDAWGVTVRDGFGQTETTVQIANTPGQPVKPGAMGRPVPGFAVVLLDPVTNLPGDEGEICLDLQERPLGLMTGYAGDPERTSEIMREGRYHTGDVGRRDVNGYITHVGRADDVFKASDYRISPFELESVLLRHPAVAEAAVVPSPDPVRLAVPKACVTLADGFTAHETTAMSILEFARENLAAYKRIRRLEFLELPKTISGKIKRAELRERELLLREQGDQPAGEFSDAELDAGRRTGSSGTLL